ncbi:thiamine pyrophosphate-dependent enzyme [Anaerosalibacter bizertensis]|uniref:Indolepyruvate oxidoreductase subunit IorA n=1 Tax=Anaerosalibacter bizertensis TaxID=932217 RepID=A0A9Q4ADQ8_9FIRM|nr:thiamine pyrophosphate-dependent enzyme [Anaerosalibacter bizertensis]MBV1821058.1 4Fe-4S binding protein [Bacteroidales bacterium MSK.15.36]MCG4565827.1 thiamine pyrophosphate-dependent enzyme [Anaerosalibacter bizertensis]
MGCKKKVVLSGNQAIARGFYEGGGKVAASYPGSPTVEILESMKEYEEIYSEFSTNEKVALEVAMGASLYGSRAMASMKHVGMNIAADPLMTFSQTPINGGFVLVSGSDPGMASSQNEQDNRIFGKFANMGILAPGSSQEAKDFMKFALDISEEFEAPILIDISSRTCHSRGIVELDDRVEKEPSGFEIDQEKYCMLPPNTYKAQYFMRKRLEKLRQYAYDMPINTLEEVDGSDTLIITSGLMYYNLKELNLPVSIYKLGMVYPISTRKVRELGERYEKIIVLEETMPFIENELKRKGIECEGKRYFPFTKELHIEDIEEGLFNAGVVRERRLTRVEPMDTVSRPPMFCAGCPHRPIFDILKKSKVKVIGDIGCYSMAVLPAFEAAHTNISMGASVGMIKGMNKAMRQNNDDEPIAAVIGDGTFFHSGLPGFVNLLHQADEEDNMTLIVLDNRTTAMTGGQPNASSGRYNVDDDMDASIKEILNAMGIKNVIEVDQFDYNKTREIINGELKKKGLSVIIATRPCALRYKIKEPYFYVDPEICIGCRSCVRTNCPPIRMKKYEGIDKLKSSIDPDVCVGCSVCAQVCPVNAIKRSK